MAATAGLIAANARRVEQILIKQIVFGKAQISKEQ